MVEQQSAHLDAVFHALADPTRRGMLRSLAAGELSIGELAAPFRMSFAGASKHVKYLERAGLVRRSVQGRQHFCTLAADRLAEADEWLRYYERFWSDRLDALENELRKPESKSKTQTRKKR
ncbi:MAG TPA: metalloregulator ArsR/SmtB family transcription factor [Candidatus Acidoferrum sp.]|nr:metalloregulator ArsR/SmtB family transcription factor [Candidatus Acidoferrum sp.]